MNYNWRTGRELPYNRKQTQIFEIGDVVRPATARNDGLVYETLSYDQDYLVVGISESTTKYKPHQILQLRPMDGIYTNGDDETKFARRRYDARNFKKMDPKNTYNFCAIILDEDNTLVAKVREPAVTAFELIAGSRDQAITEAVQELLAKNPMGKFKVFAYQKTGSLPMLGVTWS